MYGRDSTWTLGRGATRRGLVVGLALLLIAACAPAASGPAAPAGQPAAPAGGSGGASAAPAKPAGQQAAAKPEPQSVTVTLDWIGYQPHHMGFWLAKEKGWFADRGLDVTIQDARGSGQVVQLLTAGQTEFGLATAIVLTQSVAKGAPLQMVGVFTQRDNTALKYFRDSGIQQPKDLEGRTVGLVAGSVQQFIWPVFAESGGFAPDRVNMINVDIQTYNRSFAAGQFDATNALVGSTDDVQFERQGRPIGRFVLSDYVPMVGHGIVVTQKTLAERPAMVEGFVKATQRAWEYMVQSPREAVTEATEIIHKHVQSPPAADLIIEGALEPVPAMMRSRSTEGKPVGWSNPEDWRGTIGALQKAGDLPRVPTPEELMTNRFLE